jgi:hypothetical protein
MDMNLNKKTLVVIDNRAIGYFLDGNYYTNSENPRQEGTLDGNKFSLNVKGGSGYKTGEIVGDKLIREDGLEFALIEVSEESFSEVIKQA